MIALDVFLLPLLPAPEPKTVSNLASCEQIAAWNHYCVASSAASGMETEIKKLEKSLDNDPNWTKEEVKNGAIYSATRTHVIHSPLVGDCVKIINTPSSLTFDWSGCSK
jgi:hypothetical protein